MELKDWGLSQLGEDIFNKKYRFENETFEEWLDRVSNGDEEVKQLIINKKFLFAGRILSNRGLHKLGKKVTYSNCYVLSQVGDSIEDIYGTCSDLARTFSYGGGVGIDISKLRPKGAKVNNSAKETTGACSFMPTFSDVTETIGQNGRRGALMISMDINHPDIEEFIDIKTDLNQVTKANISVKVTDEFMKKATCVDEDPMFTCEFVVESSGEVITKEVNARDLYMKLCENNWNYAEPGILYWDRIENYNVLSEDKDFKYDGVNPCAEEPLPAGGSCLLGSFNLSAYVVNGKFNTSEFVHDIHVVVRAMNEVLDEGLPLHPLQIQRDTVRDYRQIGIGIMGLADMLIKMGFKYGSVESVELCDNIGLLLANQCLLSSSLLAKEYGAYPKYKKEILNSEFIKSNTTSLTYESIEKYGLRNSQLLTVAPTGSLSTMLGISGGIEPIFMNSYLRKTQSLHNEDVFYKVYTPIVDEYMKKHDITEEEDLPSFFVTAMNLHPLDRVEMQGVWQRHIDASISSTVNLPNDATVEDVALIYKQAWKFGLKGITVYRSGCAREGVLVSETKGETSMEIIPLGRGEWKSLASDTYYVKRSLTIGCGKLKLFIGYSPSEQTVQDLYIVKCGNGGCSKNLQALAISMSAIMRLGGNLEQIEKAFSGIEPCNSFVRARAKGEILSKGNYCGSAILNEVRAFLNELNDVEEIVQPKEKNEFEEVKKSEEIERGNICPDCGEKLDFTGGCNICNNCGYSKCS